MTISSLVEVSRSILTEYAEMAPFGRIDERLECPVVGDVCRAVV